MPVPFFLNKMVLGPICEAESQNTLSEYQNSIFTNDAGYKLIRIYNLQ